MFEHRSEPLIPRRQFLIRLARNAAWACALLSFCLCIGVLGYHLIEGLPWVDSLLNASMILSGMGEVDPLRTTGGKLFASGYCVLSGVMFISTIGLLLAPPMHRLMHKFHLETESAEDKDDDREDDADANKPRPRRPRRPHEGDKRRR